MGTMMAVVAKETDSSKARIPRLLQITGVLRPIIIAMILLGVGLVLFSDFVFGEKLLLYTDIGVDSVNISYPYDVLLSDYLRTEGIPMWSFRVGMGQDIFPYLGAVLITPVTWLSKNLIARALIYQHLLYTMAAGVMFAAFLTLRRLPLNAALVGALCLSFSAYLCMGSCWCFHAYEVVWFTFLLLAAELSVMRGKWLLLPIAVALVGSLGAFHLYLCALFLLFYVPIRLWLRADKIADIFAPALRLAGLAFLGVGLSAICTLGNFYAQLHSPRGVGPTSRVGQLFSAPIFGFESASHYVTALLRPFANDILGTGDNFRGWQNYLEAPMSYCGLLCLVLLPQLFIGGSRRRLRMAAAIFLCAIGVTTAFPWFRYLFWAFQGDYYRTLSLFSVLGVITLSMTVFARYSSGARLNLWLLASTVAVLLGILYLPLPEGHLIESSVRNAAVMFLLLYGSLLAAGQVLRRQQLFSLLLVMVAAAELVHFDRRTVADRATVTKSELSQRIGYNDETIDAVRDIKAADDRFFRINKTYSSGPGSYASLNDAMIFGYFGTTSYSSFNDLNYIRFLRALDTIPEENVTVFTHWATGLLDQPVLSTFACEKYVITKDPIPFEMAEQYERVGRYGSSYVLRNNMFLPLGLAYKQYLSENRFLSLSATDKSQALFHAVVLDADSPALSALAELTPETLQKVMQANSLADAIRYRRASALRIHYFSETRIEGSIEVEAPSVLVFQMPFNPGWKVLVDNRVTPSFPVDCGLFGFLLNGGSHEVQLRFTPPFLYAGAAVSFFSLVLLTLLWLRWPRLGCG
jgi:uncharacterized membrane protein YfhO